LTERENNENKSLITDKLSAADPSVVSNKLKIVFGELFDQFEMYIVHITYIWQISLFEGIIFFFAYKHL
jgi:hypothetical protein